MAARSSENLLSDDWFMAAALLLHSSFCSELFRIVCGGGRQATEEKRNSHTPRWAAEKRCEGENNIWRFQLRVGLAQGGRRLKSALAANIDLSALHLQVACASIFDGFLWRKEIYTSKRARQFYWHVRGNAERLKKPRQLIKLARSWKRAGGRLFSLSEC